jgi:hypothetical protein
MTKIKATGRVYDSVYVDFTCTSEVFIDKVINIASKYIEDDEKNKIKHFTLVKKIFTEYTPKNSLNFTDLSRHRGHVEDLISPESVTSDSYGYYPSVTRAVSEFSDVELPALLDIDKLTDTGFDRLYCTIDNILRRAGAYTIEREPLINCEERPYLLNDYFENYHVHLNEFRFVSNLLRDL